MGARCVTATIPPTWDGVTESDSSDSVTESDLKSGSTLHFEIEPIPSPPRRSLLTSALESESTLPSEIRSPRKARLKMINKELGGEGGLKKPISHERKEKSSTTNTVSYGASRTPTFVLGRNTSNSIVLQTKTVNTGTIAAADTTPKVGNSLVEQGKHQFRVEERGGSLVLVQLLLVP